MLLWVRSIISYLGVCFSDVIYHAKKLRKNNRKGWGREEGTGENLYLKYTALSLKTPNLSPLQLKSGKTEGKRKR